ncbi:MAG: hypothetical protein ABSC02_13840 [Acidobacteriota bacterium]
MKRCQPPGFTPDCEFCSGRLFCVPGLLCEPYIGGRYEGVLLAAGPGRAVPVAPRLGCAAEALPAGVPAPFDPPKRCQFPDSPAACPARFGVPGDTMPGREEPTAGGRVEVAGCDGAPGRFTPPGAAPPR